VVSCSNWAGPCGLPANYMAIVESRRLLLEILNRPNFAGAGYVNTACDFGVIGAGHVYVVIVFIEVISGALVPNICRQPSTMPTSDPHPGHSSWAHPLCVQMSALNQQHLAPDRRVRRGRLFLASIELIYDDSYSNFLREIFKAYNWKYQFCSRRCL
jgi:hypothetical protein